MSFTPVASHSARPDSSLKVQERPRDEGLLLPEEASSEWSQRNLLSLDGGGIRGYWTLLVLKELMTLIAEEEHAQDAADTRLCDSFHPQPFPDNVTQHPQEATQGTDQERDLYRFLPRHYFDVICGSSTGSLIAIMLGRFRMTIPDCLHEYKQMGDAIFGNPRHVTRLRTGIVPRVKYDATKMERAAKAVVARRCSKLEHKEKLQVRLPTTYNGIDYVRGACKTLATAKKRTIKANGQMSWDEIHLFRSYNNNPKEYHRSLDRQKTGDVRNWGAATTNMNVWQIARAATAAPWYFKRFKLKFDEEKHQPEYYIDGGYGKHNNPTELGIDEIQTRHGESNVGVVVSVGTAKTKNQEISNDTSGMVKGLGDKSTDTKEIEQRVRKRNLPYSFRFNDDDGIGVEVDAWDPKGWLVKNPGHVTIETMENKAYRWLVNGGMRHEMEQCAKELVRRRRHRTQDESRWERYANAASIYRCTVDDCNKEFKYRAGFSRHCETDHASRGPMNPAVDFWEYQQDTS